MNTIELARPSGYGIEAERPQQKTYHPKLEQRYPKGSVVRDRRDAQAELYERLAKAQGNLEGYASYPMQPVPFLLDAVIHPFDLVAPTIILGTPQRKKTITFIEDHVRADSYPFSMGKSTLVHSLLGMQSPAAQVQEVLGIPKDHKITPAELAEQLSHTDTVPIAVPKNGVSKIISGDITFFGRSPDDRLVALAPIASREDTIWDIARRGVRTTSAPYERHDPAIREAQLGLAAKLQMKDTLWAEPTKAYPVDEIVVLSPQPSLCEPALWGDVYDGANDAPRELRAQIERNPLYLSGQTTFWQIDAGLHGETVAQLMEKPLALPPAIHYLYIRDPREPENLAAAQGLLEEKFSPRADALPRPWAYGAQFN